MGNPQNVFLNALFWATACNASAPRRCDTLPETITPEKVIRHNRKAKGRFGEGDRHCPLSKQVQYNLLKTQVFYKAKICAFLKQTAF